MYSVLRGKTFILDEILLWSSQTFFLEGGRVGEVLWSCDCSFLIGNVKARKLCHFVPHKCFGSF